MSTTRSPLNAALAIGFAMVLVIVARIAISLAPEAPIYKDAASVPSTTAVPGSTQFSGAVEASRRLARDLIVRDNLPGLSVAAAVHGQIVWAEGFGRADVEGQRPLTPHTRFRLGALSKPLTAMAAAVLNEQGRLDLDAPVQRYVKAYPDKPWKLTFGMPVGLEKAERPNYSCLFGANAFLSTPTDLVRLGSAMIRPGVLKAGTLETFRTPTRLASGANATYALGWTVSTLQMNGKPVTMVSHRGSPSGGTVSLLTFPDLGIVIAAAANVNSAQGVNPLAREVAEVFARRRSAFASAGW